MRGAVTEVDCYNMSVNSPYFGAGAARTARPRDTTKVRLVMFPDSIPDGDAVKRCSRCKTHQPLDQFCKGAKSARWADGLHPWCRSCRNESARAHRHRTRANLPTLLAAAAPRLWSRVTVSPDTGCWELHGATDRKGYPRVNVAGHNVPAYWVAFAAVHGDVPRQVIMHKCDNRKCVNPAHLEPGTYSQNNADMWARGRGRGAGRLSADDVREIRRLAALGWSQRKIADRIGCTPSNVSRILGGHQWRQIA